MTKLVSFWKEKLFTTFTSHYFRKGFSLMFACLYKTQIRPSKHVMLYAGCLKNLKMLRYVFLTPKCPPSSCGPVEWLSPQIKGNCALFERNMKLLPLLVYTIRFIFRCRGKSDLTSEARERSNTRWPPIIFKNA